MRNLVSVLIVTAVLLVAASVAQANAVAPSLKCDGQSCTILNHHPVAHAVEKAVHGVGCVVKGVAHRVHCLRDRIRCHRLRHQVACKPCEPTLAFQPGPDSDRVKLLKDLTKYDPRCKEGSLGWTDPKTNEKGKVTVHYDSGAILDTYWSSMEKVAKPESAKACPGPCDNGKCRRPLLRRCR